MIQDINVAGRSGLKNGRKSRSKLSQVVARVDRLGSPVPSFNIKGDKGISTSFGGC